MLVGYEMTRANRTLSASLAMDLTIRKRRRPWKRSWKIDSVSRQAISRLSKVVRLVKRREFMLELKREGHARVQSETVEFIALPFPSSKKLKIWSFHVVVVQGRLRNVQKSVICTCKVVVLLTKPIAFLRCRCRCRCRCRRRSRRCFVRS